MKPEMKKRSYIRAIEIKTAHDPAALACFVCKQRIAAKQKYYEGGWGYRAHVDCVQDPFEELAKGTEKMNNKEERLVKQHAVDNAQDMATEQRSIKIKILKPEKPTYCTQNNNDCSTCSLMNYGMDCRNNPL